MQIRDWRTRKAKTSKGGELQAAQSAKEDLTNELLQDLAKSDDVQEELQINWKQMELIRQL